MVITVSFGANPIAILTDLALCEAAAVERANWKAALVERQQIPFPSGHVAARVEAELRNYLQIQASVKIECHGV